jgi:hypothetical protein
VNSHDIWSSDGCEKGQVLFCLCVLAWRLDPKIPFQSAIALLIT